jgi:hypothetical protein
MKSMFAICKLQAESLKFKLEVLDVTIGKPARMFIDLEFTDSAALCLCFRACPAH